MIIDRLENAALYKQLGPHFEHAFHYLKTFKPEIADNRYSLNGNGDYVLVQSYETLPHTQRTFESHQQYIDVQYVVSGCEIIYYRHASTLTPKGPYNADKDAIYYEDADDRPLAIHAGEFAIFWPHDAHKPACVFDKTGAIRKVVVKVRVPEITT